MSVLPPYRMIDALTVRLARRPVDPQRRRASERRGFGACSESDAALGCIGRDVDWPHCVADATTAVSITRAAASTVASCQRRPMSWMPIGSVPLSPVGIAAAGAPVRLAGNV